jgi:fumarate hydratase class II
MKSFDHHCAQGIEPNRKRIGELMEQSLMLVTALAPHIGYDRAAQIAKTAQHDGTTLRHAALASGFVDEQQFDTWIVPMAMTHPNPD